MKRFLRCGLRTAICCVLILAFSAMTVFADGVDITANANAKEYEGGLYTDFGDSIASGFSLQEHIDVVGYGECKTSYPAIVATALSMEETSFSVSGFRTSEVLRMLGETEEDDYYFNFWNSYFEKEGKAWFKAPENIEETIQASDLITVQIGANDVLMSPVLTAANIISEKETLRAEEDAKIKATIEECCGDCNFTEAFIKIAQLMNDLGYYKEYVDEVSDQMEEGYETFLTNFDKIMKDIQKAEPTGAVLVVGYYNPYRGLRLTDDGLLRFGYLVEASVQKINLYMKVEAKKYGYTFVDISDTECYTTNGSIAGIGETAQSGDFDYSKVDPHPTAKGNVQIAQSIVDALPSLSGTKHQTCKLCEKIDAAYTGLLNIGENIWAYVKNGKVATDVTAMVKYNGGLFAVGSGYVVSSYNGLMQDPNSAEDWYYLAQGQAVDYTGLVLYDGAWFYVENGKIDTDLVGMVSYDGGTFYVANGRVVTEANGLVQDPETGDWYFVALGQVQSQYSGVVYYNGAWFHIVNGKLA